MKETIERIRTSLPPSSEISKIIRMGRILEFMTHSPTPKVWKRRPKVTNLSVHRAQTGTQALWFLGQLKKWAHLVFTVTFILLFLGKISLIWLIFPSISRIRQYKAGKGIVYIYYASEEWDTFNCMRTFFAHFLTLKPWGITMCFLGTNNSSVCHWGGGLGGKGDWGFMYKVCRHFLLTIWEGNAIRGTERVRGSTSLCLVIVKPRVQGERDLENICE